VKTRSENKLVQTPEAVQQVTFNGLSMFLCFTRNDARDIASQSFSAVEIFGRNPNIMLIENCYVAYGAVSTGYAGGEVQNPTRVQVG
jgi:hypothetical protein